MPNKPFELTAAMRRRCLMVGPFARATQQQTVGRHADDVILWLATQAAFAGPERVLFFGHGRFRPR